MREAMLRWSFFFGGLIILGLGVALTIKGQRFGVGSWDVFHIGLFKQLGLTIGTWSIIAGIVIVIISAIGMREFPQNRNVFKYKNRRPIYHLFYLNHPKP